MTVPVLVPLTPLAMGKFVAPRSRMMATHGDKDVGKYISNAKLSEDDVRNIRRSKESQATLAQIYHVTQSVICKIKLRRTWAYVAD